MTLRRLRGRLVCADVFQLLDHDSILPKIRNRLAKCRQLVSCGRVPGLRDPCRKAPAAETIARREPGPVFGTVGLAGPPATGSRPTCRRRSAQPGTRRGDTFPRDIGGRGRSRLPPRLAAGDVLERGADPESRPSRCRPRTGRRRSAGPPPATRVAEGAVTGGRRNRVAAWRPSCPASEAGAAFLADALYVAHGKKSAVDKSRPLILTSFVAAQFKAELGMC